VIFSEGEYREYLSLFDETRALYIGTRAICDEKAVDKRDNTFDSFGAQQLGSASKCGMPVLWLVAIIKCPVLK
jgi:hypothetical protein